MDCIEKREWGTEAAKKIWFSRKKILLSSSHFDCWQPKMLNKQFEMNARFSRSYKSASFRSSLHLLFNCNIISFLCFSR